MITETMVHIEMSQMQVEVKAVEMTTLNPMLETITMKTMKMTPTVKMMVVDMVLAITDKPPLTTKKTIIKRTEVSKVN